MCWGFHGGDRVPLEDVGGTLGEDGGSREDQSPLGVCSRRLYGGASNYTRDVLKCTNGEGQAVHPIELPPLKTTPDAILDL